MGLELHEDHSVIIDDGKLIAISQNEIIEVWDDMGESLYGCLPPESTERDIRNAVRFYEEGFIVGRANGKHELQAEMKKLLGIKS